VSESFTKFPRTPHLTWLGQGEPRGDKLLSREEALEFLSAPVLVEEKVDGTNLGLSVGQDGRLRLQHRGNFFSPASEPQYKPLRAWLALHEADLRDALGDRLILYGEWCYAQHSVRYDRLPDWFLAFDVYERGEERFWSQARRDELVTLLDLAAVPALGTGRYTVEELVRLMTTSRVGSESMEGVYLRREEGDWLATRAKLVRAAWLQLDEEHWSSRPLTPNARIADAKTETRP